MLLLASLALAHDSGTAHLVPALRVPVQPRKGAQELKADLGMCCGTQECKKYPQLAEIAARVPPDAQLSKEEFQEHLKELDKSLRSLPATAQVLGTPLV
jgi:hypothetical protein